MSFWKWIGVGGAITVGAFLTIKAFDLLQRVGKEILREVEKRSYNGKMQMVHEDMSDIRLALDLFKVDIDRYPSSSEGLRALCERPPEWDVDRKPKKAEDKKAKRPQKDVEDRRDNWDGPYIESTAGEPRELLDPLKRGVEHSRLELWEALGIEGAGELRVRIETKEQLRAIAKTSRELKGLLNDSKILKNPVSCRDVLSEKGVVDPWGHPYIYQGSAPDHFSYKLISYGVDGELGGEGAAADITIPY